MSAAVEDTNCVIPSRSLYFTMQEGVFPPLRCLMYWPLMLVLLFLGILATVSPRGHRCTGDNSLSVMFTLFISFSTTKWPGPAVIRVTVSSPIFMCKDFEGRNHFLVLAHSSCLILFQKYLLSAWYVSGAFLDRLTLTQTARLRGGCSHFKVMLWKGREVTKHLQR